MPLYLAPYIGAGTRLDPWRPRGSDQTGWSAIRLLAQGVVSGDARCLLWLPTADTDVHLDKLGDDIREPVAVNTRTRLLTRLGLVNLEAVTFDELIAEILLNPPVNGWKALRPSSLTGRTEVILDGRVIWQSGPAIRGGASATEDFAAVLDTAKWEIGGGDWGLLESSGGRGRATANNVDGAIRLITPTIGDDQYAQAKCWVGGGGGVTGYTGTLVRMHSGTDESAYAGYFVESSTGASRVELAEYDSAFAYTVLATATATFVDADVNRTEAEGSTLRLKQNGIQATSATDTTIVSGQPGTTIFTSDRTLTEVDDWEGGDLTAAVAVEGRVLMAPYFSA